MPVIKTKINSGFTLIEMAIVMLIIGALIGSAILPLTAQRESSHINKARAELKTIEEALYGFAIANGRLPCPAQPGAATESPVGGTDCNEPRGFVPANTLGINGNTNCDSLLTDPWGNPYRYSVTMSDVDGTTADFTTTGNINSIKVATGSLAALAPDLVVCDVDNCATDLTSTAVAVIYSMGKNWQTVTSAGEVQNGGEAPPIASGCGLASYGISNNNEYVYHQPVEQAATQFDDIVIWMSENILYARLLAAGQL